MNTSRQIALKILYEVDFEGAYSNLALKEGLKYSELSTLDKGFVTQLVYGVISRRRTLDCIITKFSSVKLSKISDYVLEILRIGIYQMIFMDKIPDSAAVNESVKLAQKYAYRSKGFVNGILRNVSREKENISFCTLADKYSYPDFLIKMWCKDFGEERTEQILKSLNASPEMNIRVNTLKTTREQLIKLLEKEGTKAKADDLYENSVVVRRIDITSSDLFKKGFFTVQDAAAQLSSAVLAPKGGARVLDMCAAPGGKTTHMAEIMNNEGEIVALDIYDHKIKLIEENAKRLGIDIIKAKVWDSEMFCDEYIEKFDFVLVDVPCSGLGIIRRKPDIKWTANPGEELYNIQKKILNNASMYLKPGGFMVYSTCTLNKNENENRIEEFLKEHKNFELVSEKICPEGYRTFYPNTDSTDGFFICKLRKKEN